MAQTGYTPIILFHSTTASAVPTTSNLAVGELGLNNTDGKLYYNTGSAIAVLAGAGGAGIAGGSNTQVQYNSSGSLAGSANMVFNGSTLTTLNSAYTGTLTGGTGIVNLGSGQFYKDATGNVGIGTSSPTNISGGGDLTVAGRYLNGTTGATYPAYSFTTDAQSGMFLASAGNLGFSTSNSERMRIDSSGNLNVAQTSGPNGTSRLGISNDCSAQAMQIWTNTAGGSATQNIVLLYRGSTLVGSIQGSNTGTAYNTSSDYRLKENVQPMTGALDKVSKLKPCTYNWKIDGSEGQGFIAHELQEIIPEAVCGEKDGEQMQGVDTSFLVATLTAAIQEQQAIIEQLKAKVGL